MRSRFNPQGRCPYFFEVNSNSFCCILLLFLFIKSIESLCGRFSLKFFLHFTDSEPPFALNVWMGGTGRGKEARREKGGG